MGTDLVLYPDILQMNVPANILMHYSLHRSDLDPWTGKIAGVTSDTILIPPDILSYHTPGIGETSSARMLIPSCTSRKKD
jgi:hypothetical protein